MVSAWLKRATVLEGGALEAAARAAAKEALGAIDEGKLTKAHVVAVARAVEQCHKHGNGGLGPVVRRERARGGGGLTGFSCQLPLTLSLRASALPTGRET